MSGAETASPGRLTVRGVRREFPGGVTALDGVDLDLPGGEFVALVGPSGCGKTTLLRVIAGLERAGAGTVSVDGADLGPLDAAERPTAMVFQSDTLFPDQTVAQNVAFGLRMRRAGATELSDAVSVALLRMQITGLRDRYPDQLSGGQRRRVALARALVVRPAVLLLDEPLAGLEPTLRASLLHHLRATQRRFATTTIYVTHDVAEALGTADRVVLLDAGRVVQVGTPREFYTRPVSALAARAGGPVSLLAVSVPDGGDGAAEGDGGDGVRVRAFGAEVRVPAPAGLGDEALLALRPHEIALADVDDGRPGPREPRGAIGLVTEARYAGAHTEYVVETEEGTVVAHAPERVGPGGGPDGRAWPAGAAVRVAVRPGAGWLLPG